MGAWIEISSFFLLFTFFQSHPTMGAWIEIKKVWSYKVIKKGRTPRWVRGLKSSNVKYTVKLSEGRTPRWVRGLKFFSLMACLHRLLVAPHDGCVD